VTSLFVALLLVAAVALGAWLDTHPWARHQRIRFTGPLTLADVLEAKPPRLQLLKGGRRD
jgi:hypothetical protein